MRTIRAVLSCSCSGRAWVVDRNVRGRPKDGSSPSVQESEPNPFPQGKPGARFIHATRTLSTRGKREAYMNHRCALHGAVAPVRFDHRPLAAACAAALIALAAAGPALAQEAASQPQQTPAAASTPPQDAGTMPAGDKTASKRKKAAAPVTDLSRVVVTGISSSIASSMKTKE